MVAENRQRISDLQHLPCASGSVVKVAQKAIDGKSIVVYDGGRRGLDARGVYP